VDDQVPAGAAAAVVVAVGGGGGGGGGFKAVAGLMHARAAGAVVVPRAATVWRTRRWTVGDSASGGSNAGSGDGGDGQAVEGRR